MSEVGKIEIFEHLPISLRDQIAMAALPAIISSESEERQQQKGWADDAAYLAYEYADAMMRARG